MRRNLWIIEKILLTFQSRYDVKKGSVSSNKSYNNKGEAKVFSTFVSSELIKLTMKLRSVYDKHCVVVADSIQAPYKIMRVCDALSLLDKKICEIQLAIADIDSGAEAEKKHILAKRQVAEGQNAAHLIMICDKELVDLDAKAESRLIEKYKLMEVFLHEKIRVLNECIICQENILSRQILRIQYYYEAACQIDPRFRKASLGIKDFGDKLDLKCLEENRINLDETKRLLDSIAPKDNPDKATETNDDSVADNSVEKCPGIGEENCDDSITDLNENNTIVENSMD